MGLSLHAQKYFKAHLARRKGCMMLDIYASCPLVYYCYNPLDTVARRQRIRQRSIKGAARWRTSSGENSEQQYYSHSKRIASLLEVSVPKVHFLDAIRIDHLVNVSLRSVTKLLSM